MDHQALVSMAEGVLLTFEEIKGDIPNPEIEERLRQVLQEKSALLMQAAKSMVALDKKELAVTNEIYGNENNDVESWSDNYPMLNQEE